MISSSNSTVDEDKVLWAIMSCQLVNSYWHFSAACYYQLQLFWDYLKIEEATDSETPETTYISTSHHITEGFNIQHYVQFISCCCQQYGLMWVGINKYELENTEGTVHGLIW